MLCDSDSKKMRMVEILLSGWGKTINNNINRREEPQMCVARECDVSNLAMQCNAKQQYNHIQIQNYDLCMQYMYVHSYAVVFVYKQKIVRILYCIIQASDTHTNTHVVYV